MSDGSFTYDVFFSHSSKDKEAVHALAERLKADGVRVWLDAWEIQAGDNIPAKIEDGLEQSRLLVLCMSVHAFGSDWSALESQTFRFRDPLNKQRRFVPLRLDDANPKGSLAQFAFVDWREGIDGEYTRLLEACRSPKHIEEENFRDSRFDENEKAYSLGHTSEIQALAFSPTGKCALSGGKDFTVRLWEVESGQALQLLEGHTNAVWSVAFSMDGRYALSGSEDLTVRLWELESGRSLQVMEGHTGGVHAVAFSPDGRYALSGGSDRTLRLWDLKGGSALRVLKGDANRILSVAFSPDGRYAVSGSDTSLRLWDVESGSCLKELHGHSKGVVCVSFSLDGKHVYSGGVDRTLRQWDVSSGRERGLVRVLSGSTDTVISVALSPNQNRALTGSAQNTVRLWALDWGANRGSQLQLLKGHANSVLSVASSPDGKYVLSGSEDHTVRLWEAESGRELRAMKGHTQRLSAVAFSPDGKHALSAGEDFTLRLWHMESGQELAVLDGQTGGVRSVTFSPDGAYAISGHDQTLRLWDIESGRELRALKGHTAAVSALAFSPDGEQALSGSFDKTLRLWEVQSGNLIRVLEGHSSNILTLAFRPDGKRVLSGSADGSLRLWDVKSGNTLRILEGHAKSVSSVAFSPDGRYALSGSDDRTLRLWDAESGKALRVLEGHTYRVSSVGFSWNGKYALSGSDDKTLRLWEVQSGRTVRVLKGHTSSVCSLALRRDGKAAFSAGINGVWRSWKLPEFAGAEKTVIHEALQYTNAKVLLVGESGAGKTGLSKRLALGTWEPSDSTVGAWATQWKLPLEEEGGEREIWLWDFGGQSDQRLIHQLYMDETALAVLVFDGQKEDIFETLGQWDREITRAARRPFQKLLAAGRIDAGGLRVSRSQMQGFVAERGFADYLGTSAKTGDGCEELKKAIIHNIRWEDIPWRSSPAVFKRLKEEMIALKDEGRVLMRFNELRETLRLRMAGKSNNQQFGDEQLHAVVSLLAGPGVVWEPMFGSWVLLQPERINAYAQAVIQSLRADPHERGCILEEKVLNCELSYQSSMPRLPEDDERIVLLAMHQVLVSRGLCLREPTETGTLLIFPSYYRRERPDIVGHPTVFVSYQFSGFLDDIYATLVVRLHHTKSFEKDELWRYAADFRTLTRRRLGVKLTRRAEGAGELEVYFDPDIPIEEKIIFSRYVHEHLLQKAHDVTRLRHYVCPYCQTPVGNRAVAMRRLAEGKKDILCVDCERRVPLWDGMEELFARPEMQSRVRQLEQESRFKLDSESKDRILVGEVISTVALAGQISREFPCSNHGIDMEIEFKCDSGEASGKRLYLVLESDLRLALWRHGGDAESFTINESHARYWMLQPFPVMLVIRESGDEVRWMDVRTWLSEESRSGQMHRIRFIGERLDVMSVRRWRGKMGVQ